MDDPPDVVTLISGLRSENESARKYAVFKLQALLSDPSFADAFVQGDGVVSLRDAVMQTTGNTQAYALGSLDKLLELDMGWEGGFSGSTAHDANMAWKQRASIANRMR